MASKSSLQKLQDAVVGTVRGVVKDPVGSAGKAIQQAKGTIAIGKVVAGQVARTATGRTAETADEAPEPVTQVQAPPAAAVTDDEHEVAITPADVARVVAKKSPAEKPAATKAPAKKAPAKKAASSPSGKLPPRKPPAKKAPTRVAPAEKSPGDLSG